jgi:hypothetical protein
MHWSQIAVKTQVARVTPVYYFSPAASASFLRFQMVGSH